MTDFPRDFRAGYVAALLFTDTSFDDECAGMDESDFAPETVARIDADCAAFWRDVGHLVTEDVRLASGGWSAADQAGHDFWMTRNGHGVGFWDGDWLEPAASKLTDAARRAGAVDVFKGDDGKVHLG